MAVIGYDGRQSVPGALKMTMGNPRRPILAAAVLAIAVAGLLLFGRSSDTGGQSGPAQSSGLAQSGEAGDTVERCLERMLAAARAGDMAAYVACFDGELRDRVQAGIAGQPPERAAAELRAGEADLKSFATHRLERPGPNQAVVTLERIYSRRHDVQRVRLRRDGEGQEWKIVELVPVERVAPQIPYGTPVVPEAAEAQ
jgi:hypothetical protein